MTDEEKTLKAVFDSAREKARANPSVENREAAKAAWAAYVASAPKRKVRGHASRAGKQQAARRRAEQAARNYKALDRRWK